MFDSWDNRCSVRALDSFDVSASARTTSVDNRLANAKMKRAIDNVRNSVLCRAVVDDMFHAVVVSVVFFSPAFLDKWQSNLTSSSWDVHLDFTEQFTIANSSH